MNETLVQGAQDVAALSAPLISVDLLEEGCCPLAASAGGESPGDESVAEDGAGIGHCCWGGESVDYAASEGDQEGVSDEEAVSAGLVVGLHARCSQHFAPELLLGFGLGLVLSAEPLIDFAKASVRWLKDFEGVWGYPGLADRLDVENRNKLVEQILGSERPERVQAVLRDGAGDVVVVPNVPDAAIGENAGPALFGMVFEGKTASLVIEFAEQVSFELLKGRLVVVAWLRTVRVGGEAVGLGFDEDAPAGEV